MSDQREDALEKELRNLRTILDEIKDNQYKYSHDGFYARTYGGVDLPEEKLYKIDADKSVLRRAKFSALFWAVMTAFSAVGLAIIAAQTKEPRALFGPAWPLQSEVKKEDMEDVRSAIKTTDNQIQALNARFQALSIESNDQVTSAELAGLKRSLSAMDSRLGLLEKAISESPEKALSLPLMRKDLEAISRQADWQSAELRSVAGSIDSLRTLMITGLGGLLLTGLTMLGNYWLSRNAKTRKESEGKAA